MKKLIILLFMILISAPIYVSACEPAIPPAGIIIEIDYCDLRNEVNELVTFDVLVRKSEFPSNYLRSSIHNEYWSDMGFGHLEGTIDDHLNIDNEWISLGAYFQWEYSIPNNFSCGASFDFNDEFQLYDKFTTFKVVVFDSEGNILNESEEYNTSILLSFNERDEDNYKIKYNKPDNVFSLEEYNVNWDSFDSACSSFPGTGLINLIGFLFTAPLVIFFIIIEVILQPLVLRSVEYKGKMQLQVLLANIVILALFFIGISMNLILYLALLLFVGFHIYKFKILRSYDRKLSVILSVFDVVILVSLIIYTMVLTGMF